MAITFPSSPSNGQTFTVGVVTYTYDAVSGAWSAAPLPTAQPFNYLVNGSMQVSQEMGVTTTSVSGSYIADQWQAAGTIIAKSINGRAVGPSPNGSRFILFSQISTLTPALAAGDYQNFVQSIEGARFAPFQYGGATAKQAVLRFWVYTSVAGNYGGSIRNGAANRSYTFQFSNTAATWNKKEIVIPGDTVGTWPKDGTTAMNLWFAISCGTTLRTAPNVWTAGNFVAPSGISNTIANTASGYFAIADAGLYLDPALTGRAPPFESVPDQIALMDAQRYWNKAEFLIGLGAELGRAGARHPVPMRGAPANAIVGAPTIYNGSTNNAMSTIVNVYGNTTYCEINGTVGGSNAGAPVNMLGNANAYIANNAR